MSTSRRAAAAADGYRSLYCGPGSPSRAGGPALPQGAGGVGTPPLVPGLRGMSDEEVLEATRAGRMSP